MGWVTAIRVPEQVEYRLTGDCGCDRKRDVQIEYRLAGASDLRWIGSGVRELGLVPGAAVDADAARALMDGRDWRTGEQLVRRKRELDPRGKLSARVLVGAINAVAKKDGVTGAEYLGTPGLAARLQRAERGLIRDGEAHLLPVADIERLAAAAGLEAEALYGADAIAEARRWMHRHVDVGLRGVDLVLDLPKSISTAYALAGGDVAAAIEEEWLASVTEAVTALEEWTAYGMRGHHGDGQRAERVPTSGLLGWTTLHRSARPVDAGPGDPHLHLHVNIAHLARCEDGKWRTIAAGTEDLHRHARVINEIAEALMRARLIERHGARFERPEAWAWELAEVPEELRAAFSRRHQQVIDLAGEGASRDQQKAAARASAEAKREEDDQTPRADWRTRAAAVLCGPDAVDAMVAAALPGPGGSAPALGASGGPRMPTPEEIAALVWDSEHGLVASRKVVSRTHVMAAVAQAAPYLLDVQQLVELTDAVLAVEGHRVQLSDGGRVHQSNRQRYTHTSILAAEQLITETATARLAEGAAQLTAEAAELAAATFEAGRGFELGGEQRAVVHRLLTAGHGLDVVVGVAGAGKTTLMAAARTGWEAAGLTVAGASTAAVAAAGLAAEAGIASRTVAGWLRDIEGGGRGLADVDVLVVDEAAMVDDRAMAKLLAHATEHGTKLVAVGDWQQLRAIGVGGGFRAAHDLVDGLALTENRRQRDAVERLALQTWRDGGRTTALAALAEHGRVHAVRTPEEAHAAILAAWMRARREWDGDPHGLIAGLHVLAARNEDVELLNGAARTLRKREGELTGERTYALAGGRRLDLAAGDLVRVRRNDYRSRRDPGAPDVLNGYRGQVTHAQRSGVRVEWARPGPDGQVIESAWITADQIAAGALSHGYAMTIAAAQGTTADLALVYGIGADAHSLYPALSRARQATHLWLPVDVLEDPGTRARLGQARTDAELLHRAVAAYGRSLEADRPDTLVLHELTGPVPPLPPQRVQPPAEPARQEQDQDHGAASAHRLPQQHRQAASDGEAGSSEPQPLPDIARLVDQTREHLAADGEVPEPQPAEPTAAQVRARLEEAGLTPEAIRDRIAEARQAGAEQARQPRPAEPEPEVEHWRRRPWGHLPTTGLDGAATEQLAHARRAEELAAQYERQARDRAAELAASPSPGQAAAAKAAAVLEQADRLAHTSQEEGQRAAAAAAAAARARQVLAAVQKTTGRSRLALRLAGTSRKEQQQLIGEFTSRRIAADHEQLRARRAAHDAHRQAAEALRSFPLADRYRQLGDEQRVDRVDADEMRRRIAVLHRQLPAYADQVDRRRAEDLQRLQRQAAEARSNASGDREAAAALRAEQQLRRTLSPGRQATEVRERTAAARLAQQQRAERQRQQAEQQQAAHRYQPPGRGRGGPGIGR